MSKKAAHIHLKFQQAVRIKYENINNGTAGERATRGPSDWTGNCLLTARTKAHCIGCAAATPTGTAAVCPALIALRPTLTN